MGLYDIMDEIAAKQVTKSETGDNRLLGVVVGVVAKNYDQQMPGRICVQIPVRDDKANELKWARLAMPSSGTEWGHYFLPEVGDQVLLAFEHGNIEKPYVIGGVPKDSNKFLTGSVHEKNQIKRIVTKNGSTIQFDDVENEEGKGKKDKISIFTPDKAHQFIMDNEKNKILISDKEEKNKICIESEKGNISIDTVNKLTIKVGDNIEVIMNAQSGTVSVKCGKFKVDASDNASVSTNGKLGLTGGNLVMEASSMLKATSSGMATIGGSPVKIG